jgi:hypothetical protein
MAKPTNPAGSFKQFNFYGCSGTVVATKWNHG